MNFVLNLKKGVKAVYFYVAGNFIAKYAYDRKYLTGRWFHTRWHNIGAEGWEWLVRDYRGCKKLGVNRNVRWPVSPLSNVKGLGQIIFDPDDINNFQASGCYFQCVDNITIGKGTYIAPNVGIITANHSFTNLDLHAPSQPVIIGRKCWIGMNAIILPGVVLGENTIVGAGSVVTRSFPQGHCVIAGNPARIIKLLTEEGSVVGEV